MDREDWNRRWQERRLHCHADDPSAVLAAELGALAPGRALDLGCGAGRSSIWLAERGWQVTGVDFSDAALELARAARPDADWVLADLREYEPAAAAYDLVLLLYVHVPPDERRAILRRAARALAPGGTVLVLGHDLENLGTGAPGPSRPEVLYTAAQIGRELDGLDVARAGQERRLVETDDGKAEAVDTLVVARRA
jgi:SAM-dependent methyltransferase